MDVLAMALPLPLPPSRPRVSSSSSSFQHPPHSHEGRCCKERVPRHQELKRNNGRSVTDCPYLEQSLNGLSHRRWFAISFFSTALVCANGVLGVDRANADVVGTENDKPEESLALPEEKEETKLGRLLPKTYLNNAREVVKSLRDTLLDESNNSNIIRRSPAKEAIRNYLLNLGDQKKLVASEDSYKALQSAFRILADFYMKRGPQAVMPTEVKVQILEKLKLADAAL